MKVLLGLSSLVFLCLVRADEGKAESLPEVDLDGSTTVVAVLKTQVQTLQSELVKLKEELASVKDAAQTGLDRGSVTKLIDNYLKESHSDVARHGEMASLDSKLTQRISETRDRMDAVVQKNQAQCAEIVGLALDKYSVDAQPIVAEAKAQAREELQPTIAASIAQMKSAINQQITENLTEHLTLDQNMKLARSEAYTIPQVTKVVTKQVSEAMTKEMKKLVKKQLAEIRGDSHDTISAFNAQLEKSMIAAAADAGEKAAVKAMAAETGMADASSEKKKKTETAASGEEMATASALRALKIDYSILRSRVKTQGATVERIAAETIVHYLREAHIFMQPAIDFTFEVLSVYVDAFHMIAKRTGAAQKWGVFKVFFSEKYGVFMEWFSAKYGDFQQSAPGRYEAYRLWVSGTYHVAKNSLSETYAVVKQWLSTEALPRLVTLKDWVSERLPEVDTIKALICDKLSILTDTQLYAECWEVIKEPGWYQPMLQKMPVKLKTDALYQFQRGKTATLDAYDYVHAHEYYFEARKQATVGLKQIGVDDVKTDTLDLVLDVAIVVAAIVALLLVRLLLCGVAAVICPRKKTEHSSSKNVSMSAKNVSLSAKQSRGKKGAQQKKQRGKAQPKSQPKSQAPAQCSLQKDSEQSKETQAHSDAKPTDEDSKGESHSEEMAAAKPSYASMAATGTHPAHAQKGSSRKRKKKKHK